jgi:hypothetical protein
MFREGPGRQQRASLTFQDATGRQFVFDVHETFYMRSAGLRERLDAWDIAGELRNGARTIRLDEESFHVVERYA